jgi:hypothetical protein
MANKTYVAIIQAAENYMKTKGLGAAGLYKLRGSKSSGDVFWINLILRLFTR